MLQINSFFAKEESGFLIHAREFESDSLQRRLRLGYFPWLITSR